MHAGVAFVYLACQTGSPGAERFRQVGRMMNLQDSVVMVVGAGRGIGRRAAELFHEHGAHLAIASRNEAELAELRHKLKRRPNSGEVLAQEADATDNRSIRDFVEVTRERFRRIDLLLYAAGVGLLKPFAEITDEDFGRVMNTNARGAFLTLKAVLPVMEEQRSGHVIALPGILGRAPMAGGSVYAASKYALTGMLKSLALEYKRANVRISLLHFGGVNSSFWDTITMRVERERMLTVDAAAQAVLFAAMQDGEGVLGELTLQPASHQM